MQLNYIVHTHVSFAPCGSMKIKCVVVRCKVPATHLLFFEGSARRTLSTCNNLYAKTINTLRLDSKSSSSKSTINLHKISEIPMKHMQTYTAKIEIYPN